MQNQRGAAVLPRSVARLLQTTFGEWLANELLRRISSLSAFVRTARSGSFGVACRPADIRTRLSSHPEVANLPRLTARHIAICRGSACARSRQNRPKVVVSAGVGQKGGRIGQRGHYNCCNPYRGKGENGNGSVVVIG